MDEDLLILTVKESGERIDALLSRTIEGMSRNGVQRLIDSGQVLINGSPVKKNYRCCLDDTIEVSLPEPELSKIIPEAIPLDIIYEDNDLIVINKARGMVVHPAPGHCSGTLVNALLYHCGDSLSGIGGKIRPGIVHRIDKDTSGLIIVAKNDMAHAALSAQLSDHTLHREYLAVVRGHFKDISGVIDAPIGRHPVDRKRMAVTQRNCKNAVTHWQLVKSFRDYSLVRCVLETGRTHQIRVHMSYKGHPLLGDALYGGKSPEKGLEGQCLHAYRIEFIHPATNEKLAFESPLPQYFNDVLSSLGPESDM